MSRIEQMELFPGYTRKAKKPVNVATVPFRSPFRYPGGKTWFVPTFRQWIKSMSIRPSKLIEPFAGGGIISLTAVFEDLVDEVLLIELDEEVAAVWQVILGDDAQWLADAIFHFDLTTENLNKHLSTEPQDTKELAFQTILKNRTFHGGILAKGSGLMKNGENGKGLKSRWYPKTLYKRLIDISMISDRIDFSCENGLDTMEEFVYDESAVFFIDPPYTAGGKRAGKRLYKYNEIDHEHLFDICAAVEGDFLMTYDISSEVKELVRKHSFDMRTIPMRNTHNNKLYELIIGRDLSWIE